MLENNGFIYPPVTKTDIYREIYVTSIGRLHYEAGAIYPCAGHPQAYDFDWQRGRELGDFAIVFVECGTGEFEDRRLGRIVIREGDILLLPPGVWHRYRPNRSEGWTESWVCANGSLFHRLRAKALFPRAPLVRSLQNPAGFCSTHAELRKMADVGNSFRLSARALDCFGVALEGLEIGHYGDTHAFTGNDVVDRAIEFILLNCHRPLDVPTVADALHTTRRTLERAFAVAHVRGVSEEIAWSRMERAKLMIAEGNMTLKEVGHATGFGGAKRLVVTFSRFKQPLPRTPRARPSAQTG